MIRKLKDIHTATHPRQPITAASRAVLAGWDRLADLYCEAEDED